jgi:hypothetical protein
MLMAVFLKLVGTKNVPAPEPYRLTYVDFSPKRNPQGKIKKGDKMLLYACGGRKCVFATATVKSKVPYDSKVKEWPYRLDIVYDIRVSQADGVSLDQVDAGRDLQARIRGSYFALRQEEFDQAEALLAKKRSG